MKIKEFIIYFFAFFALSDIGAQDAKRPAIWGVAKMTFYISDIELARSYYGKFLGFDECFSYSSDQGKVISFKVNDRQYLEFVADKNMKDKRLTISFSFETENFEQMRQYLKSKGMEVPNSTRIDGAKNEVISVKDPAGNTVEFIKYQPNSLHSLSKGKYLSDRRISKRIHHFGIYAEKVATDDPFYAGILGFKEMWRSPEDPKLPPNYLYMLIPECCENIELLNSGGVNTTHPCLLVEDMQETIYTLKERRVNESLANPMIGKGNRWLLNIMNSDKIKVEFTEAHTVR